MGQCDGKHLDGEQAVAVVPFHETIHMCSAGGNDEEDSDAEERLDSKRLELTRAVKFGDAPRFSVESLVFSGPTFDPSTPWLKAELVSRLGFQDNATITKLREHGGCNIGIWEMRTPTCAFILKLVSSKRAHSLLPTDAERIARLAKEHPKMLADPSLAFPIKVYNCLSADSGTRQDLVIMPKAPGESLAHVIGKKWIEAKVKQMMQILEAAGAFLAGVHAAYGVQHGDCTPTNIFFDEETSTFTLIDLADLGPKKAKCEHDTERFLRCLELMSQARGPSWRDQILTGPDLYSQGKERFEAGYCNQSLHPSLAAMNYGSNLI